MMRMLQVLIYHDVSKITNTKGSCLEMLQFAKFEGQIVSNFTDLSITQCNTCTGRTRMEPATSNQQPTSNLFLVPVPVDKCRNIAHFTDKLSSVMQIDL